MWTRQRECVGDVQWTLPQQYVDELRNDSDDTPDGWSFDDKTSTAVRNAALERLGVLDAVGPVR